MKKKMIHGCILGLGILILLGCGGSSSTNTDNDSQDRVINYINSSQNPPSVEDYLNLNISGVNETNLNEVNLLLDSLNITETEEIQEVINNRENSLSIFQNYASTNGESPSPSKEDYIAIGITGVSDNNLEEINHLIAEQNSNNVDTKGEIDAFITLYQENTSTTPELSRGEDDFDEIAPILTLLGDSTLSLTIGDVYVDAGATATDNLDGNISENIIINNPVNTNIEGVYTITYNVQDSSGNQASEIKRTVQVNAVNNTDESSPVHINTTTTDTTKPIITLNGEEHITLFVGDQYQEAGATAFDNVDGNITANIQILSPVNSAIAGEYIVRYNVSDQAGNQAEEVERTVTIQTPQDSIKPVITLNGEEHIRLFVGDQYQEAGATAFDNVDGNITANIQIHSNVDMSTAGSYTVTYNVTDQAGNQAEEVERTIKVEKEFEEEETQSKTTYHVSPIGDDGNSGKDIDQSLKSIKYAIEKAKLGDTITIHGGVYREGLINTNDSNLTIQSYNNEKVIIKGSVEVNSWEHYQGNIWKLGAKESDNSGLDRTIHFQQVFYNDGKELQKVGFPNYITSRGQSIWEVKKRYIKIKENSDNPFGMSEGTFYVSENDGEFDLYVWLPDGKTPNDNDVTMEVSDKQYILNTSKHDNIKIKGIIFMHTAAQSAASIGNAYQGGYALRVGINTIIEDCEFNYTDFVGINLSRGSDKDTIQNQVVRHCKIHHNGAVGVSASSKGVLIEDSEFYENGQRPFLQYWHSGAIKINNEGSGEIRNNLIYDERAQGIWFDHCKSGEPILVHHNYINGVGNPTDNPLRVIGARGHGIFFEQSMNIKVYNNIINNAIQRGTYISASKDVIYSNNLVRGSNLAQLAIRYRDDKDPGAFNIKVLNNIFLDKRGKYDMKAFYESQEDSVFDPNNELKNNIIYNADGEYKASFATAHWSLDDNLKGINPLLDTTSSNLSEWKLLPSSSLIDHATIFPFITDDLQHHKRDAQPDIGPFEYIE